MLKQVLCCHSNKRYFKIDQYLARHFVYYGECPSYPTPFLCSQITTPFLNSFLSTNHEKGFEFQPTVEPLYPYSPSSVESILFEHE